jgi:hypothetical protein
LSKKADKAVAEAESKLKNLENKEKNEQTKVDKAEDIKKQMDIGHAQGETLKK